METALATFDTVYTETRENIYNELKERRDYVVLNTMKAFLRQNRLMSYPIDANIEFNPALVENVELTSNELALQNCTDLETFKKLAEENLDKVTQLSLANIEKSLNEELGTLTEALHNGSQSAFQRFTENIGDFAKGTAKFVLQAFATKATLMLLPPGIRSAALATAILLPAGYNAIKNTKKSLDENKDAAIDALLLKLSAVENKNQNIPDDEKVTFNIPQNIMNSTKEMLEREDIKIDTRTSELFLRDVIDLDRDNKLRVINNINTLLGNKYNVDEEIEKLSGGLKQIMKVIQKDAIAPLSNAALVGLTIGTSLAQQNAPLYASIITGLATGGFSGNLCKATLLGSTQFALSQYGSAIPIVGGIVDKTMNAVNSLEIQGTTVGALVLGTLAIKVLPILVYKASKGTINLFREKAKSNDNMKKLFTQVKKVRNDIDISAEEANEELGTKTYRQISMDIITDTLRARGIFISHKPKTAEELKQYISQLNDKDKEVVFEITKSLKDVKEDSEKNLSKTLMNLGKVAYWSGVIALAGLGMYDAFINPGFIEGLTTRDELSKTAQETGKNLEDVIKDKAIESDKTLIANTKELSQTLPNEADKNAYLIENYVHNDTEIINADIVKNYLTQSGLSDANGTVNVSNITNALNNLNQAPNGKQLIEELKTALNVENIEEIAQHESIQKYFNWIYYADDVANIPDSANTIKDVLNNIFYNNIKDMPAHYKQSFIKSLFTWRNHYPTTCAYYIKFFFTSR